MFVLAVVAGLSTLLSWTIIFTMGLSTNLLVQIHMYGLTFPTMSIVAAFRTCALGSDTLGSPM
jgi:hypothetical protein